MEAFKLRQRIWEDGNESFKQQEEEKESQAEGPGHTSSEVRK